MQEGYVAAPDIFAVSGTWEGGSSALPVNGGVFRCTDVYQRQHGKWLIVNEHCSTLPPPAPAA